jgi:hypothetical protein
MESDHHVDMIFVDVLVDPLSNVCIEDITINGMIRSQ